MRNVSRDFLRVSAGILLTAGAGGCLPRSNPPSDFVRRQRLTVSEPARSGARSDALTSDEIELSGVLTVSDGVRRLRPEFVRPRVVPGSLGGTLQGPVVYIDGGYAGGLDVLDRVLLDELQDIRLIRAAQAQSWWGASCRCAAGVIHVRTRRAR